MQIPTGLREAQLIDAIDQLLDARRTNTPISDLPQPLQPTSLDEVAYMQDTMAEVYGSIGGWKIGAPSPSATPIIAPMPAAWIGPNGSTLSRNNHRFRGLEAEVAFLLGHDLPLRQSPYSRDEVLAAIQSCHPAIEVLESGLVDPTAASRMSMLADLQMHGGFVFGPSCQTWRSVDFSQERVTLAVDGSVRAEGTGSNTSGDLLRLLPWLANEGAARTGGLKAGQWITTGSWTGHTLATASSAADVHFSTLGMVSLRFE